MSKRENPIGHTTSVTRPPAVKRVLFDPVGIKRLFHTRHDSDQLGEQYKAYVEKSLLYLSFYFDEIVIAPGAFFVAFNKAQVDQMANALTGRFSTLLAKKGMLFTYGDHVDEASLTSSDWTGSNSYAQRLIDRYKEQKLFSTPRWPTDATAIEVQKRFFHRLRPLHRPIIKANGVTQAKIEKMIELDVNDKERDFLQRLRDYTVSDALGFHHQQMLWAWSSGKTADWRLGEYRSSYLMGEIDRMHQASKELTDEPVFRYGGHNLFRGGNDYIGKRFDPILLSLLFDTLFRDDFLRYLLSLSDEQISFLIDRSKSEGFQSSYHSFLRDLDLDEIIDRDDASQFSYGDKIALKKALLTPKHSTVSAKSVASVAMTALSPVLSRASKIIYAFFIMTKKDEVGQVIMRLNNPKLYRFLQEALVINQYYVEGPN